MRSTALRPCVELSKEKNRRPKYSENNGLFVVVVVVIARVH